MDKVLHFLVSAAIVFTLYFITGNLIGSVGVGILAGIFKELIDQYVLKTGWDIKDILADLLGITFAVFILV